MPRMPETLRRVVFHGIAQTTQPRRRSGNGGLILFTLACIGAIVLAAVR